MLAFKGGMRGEAPPGLSCTRCERGILAKIGHTRLLLLRSAATDRTGGGPCPIPETKPETTTKSAVVYLYLLRILTCPPQKFASPPSDTAVSVRPESAIRNVVCAHKVRGRGGGGGWGMGWAGESVTFLLHPPFPVIKIFFRVNWDPPSSVAVLL